jgi:hypothetical protein
MSDSMLNEWKREIENDLLEAKRNFNREPPPKLAEYGDGSGARGYVLVKNDEKLTPVFEVLLVGGESVEYRRKVLKEALARQQAIK